MQENFKIGIDFSLITALLVSKNHDFLLRRNFDSSYLMKDAKGIYDFAMEYKRANKVLPSVKLIHEKFGLVLPTPEGSLEYYFEEILKRKIHDKFQDSLVEAHRLMSEGDPLGAVEYMRVALRNELNIGTSIIRLQDYKTASEDLKKSYLEAKDGKTGILFPWPTMNDWTNGGMRPGDLSLLVARAGQGKTWQTIPIAVNAANAGYRVLYISGEMDHEALLRRTLAYDLKLPYSKLLKGKLSEIDERRYFEKLDEKRAYYLDHMKVFEIASTNCEITFDKIQSQIDSYGPHLIIADSCYRYTPTKRAKDSNEATKYVFEDLKNTAMGNKLHIFATSQLNRDGAKGKKKGAGMALENIAMSDNTSWIPTNVFGSSHPERKEGDKGARTVDIYRMKLREGGDYTQDKISISWDFEKMDFSEKEETSLFGSYSAGFNPDRDDDVGMKSETDEEGYALF